MMEHEREPLISTTQARGTKRYGVIIASVFVVGTICGSGVLAIPQAVVNSGWSGVALLIISGTIAAYNGTLLGNCWSALQLKYPDYAQVRVTDPYPTIGFRAAGKLGQYATRACIDATLFGGGTVFILLIAENVKNLIHAFGGGTFSICYLVMIIWCILTPISWFGTPKDFWQAGIIAAATTSVGALLIVVGVVQDADLHEHAPPKNISASSFFSAFGTILYAFGGASVFPTIQVDMEEPNKFPLAAVIGMITILILYLPAGISGFVVFGSAMKSNVINALSDGPVSYTINILVTSHLVMAFIIISNPVTQDIEGLFNIPDRFSWKRVVVRTLYTLGIAFVALSIPHFSVILALVGGSAIACTSFIFPPLFYYLLSRQLSEDGSLDDDDGDNGSTAESLLNYSEVGMKKMSVGFKLLLFLFIFVGVAGGLCSTYFAIASLVNGESGFTVPCYVNATVE